jgi:hypothetical protein
MEKTTAKYLAAMDTGETALFSTIRAARAWAEGYGTLASRCTITDRKGRLVALHMRDHNGDGLRWFRAQI